MRNFTPVIVIVIILLVSTVLVAVYFLLIKPLVTDRPLSSTALVPGKPIVLVSEREQQKISGASIQHFFAYRPISEAIEIKTALRIKGVLQVKAVKDDNKMDIIGGLFLENGREPREKAFKRLILVSFNGKLLLRYFTFNAPLEDGRPPIVFDYGDIESDSIPFEIVLDSTGQKGSLKIGSGQAREFILDDSLYESSRKVIRPVVYTEKDTITTLTHLEISAD